MSRRFAMWVVVALIALSFGAKSATDEAKLQAKFTGFVTIEGNLATDATVDIVANGPGETKEFGALTNVEVRWTVKREVALGLLSGDLKEAPVNQGTFKAENEAGDAVEGTFAATVKRHGKFHFEVEGEFQLTSGTGAIEGITGTGKIVGVLDLRTTAYVGKIDGRIALPSP